MDNAHGIVVNQFLVIDREHVKYIVLYSVLAVFVVSVIVTGIFGDYTDTFSSGRSLRPLGRRRNNVVEYPGANKRQHTSIGDDNGESR